MLSIAMISRTLKGKELKGKVHPKMKIEVIAMLMLKRRVTAKRYRRNLRILCRSRGELVLK